MNDLLFSVDFNFDRKVFTKAKKDKDNVLAKV